MERRSKISKWILFAVFMLVAMPAGTALGQMIIVDDNELARTNAPLMGPASPNTVSLKINIDNVPIVPSQTAGMPGDKSFNLNLPSGNETWTYSYSTLNPNYWGGTVIGTRSR